MNKAIHINVFKLDKDKNIEDDLGETRGGIKVGSGVFTGMSSGKGSGPRYLHINGPGVQVRYKLSLSNGKDKLNLHHNLKYNQNQPLLYQQAIEAFERYFNDFALLRMSFKFTCYNNDYIATRE